MLTQKELEAAVRKMIANLDEVNLYFIQKIATQIKKIGEMNPTNIHRYTIMLEMIGFIRCAACASSAGTSPRMT